MKQKLIIAAALTFSSSTMAQATLITDRDNVMDWLRANVDKWVLLSSVRGHYDGLIEKGQAMVGAEVDEPRARDVEIEVADVIVGKSEYAGKSLQELGDSIGFGVNLKAMFRQGNELPRLPETIVEVGDVLRLVGSGFHRWVLWRLLVQ